MSNIVDKKYKASDMIVRPLFRGSPNLFTAPDLNRALELIMARLDNIEGMLGVKSDIGVSSCNGNSGTATLTITGTRLIVRGADFSTALTQKSFSLGSLSVGNKAFLVLKAATELKTYDNDSTHNISGAKFEDGSTKSAADHEVWKSSQLSLVKDVPADAIAVIGWFEYDEGDISFNLNSVSDWTGVAGLVSGLSNEIEPEVITEQEISTILSF